MLSRLASSALTLSVLALTLTACDLKPAPKVEGIATGGAMVDPSTKPKPEPQAAAGSAAPTPTPTPPPTPTPSPTPTPAAGSADAAGSGSAAAIQVSEACVTTTSKIAQVMINAASDPTQKAALEQDRTKLIRRMAEACTRDLWNPKTQMCFQDATTTEALQKCSQNLSAP